MKNKFTILGCGSSLGSPWITSYTGKLKKNSKNQRTRCCAHIQKGNLSVLIDTSPDIKHQFLKNKIKTLDSIIYTHEHADQTAGIFEMRPFYWKNKSKIPIYGSSRTIKALKKAGWQINDLDLIESNEAFAAQSLAVIKDLGIPEEKLNVNGGAIALGHPIGASGARILVTLIHEMNKRKAKKGLATLCVGGGMGIAMCIEGNN